MAGGSPVEGAGPRPAVNRDRRGCRYVVGSLVLPSKLVELMAIAADASCTHLYTPGIRRHIAGALAHGATLEEIMEVLKLCGAIGIDACELGAPILAQELSSHHNDDGR